MDFLDKLFGTFDKSNFVQIRLSGEIPEEEEKSFLPTMGAKKSLTMWDIEKVLTHVENSAKLLGVIISLSELRIGFARANLIRQRLSEIRASGKKVIVHLESGGNIEYLIASAADKIYMTPWGTLNLIGLKAEVTFYKDALDKIGVSANMKGFGEYKSAAETFTRDSMSTPHKEMMDSILDDLQTQLEGHISKGRGITPKEVKNLIDNGPYMTDIAQDNALIDGVCYETQLEENISILLQADLSLVKAGNLVRKLNILNKLRSLIGKFGSNYPVIAVVSDSGMITLGESKGSGPVKSMGSESLNKLLDKVSSDRKVRALVLRVLSPGGSAVASDLICKKLEEISQTRPVVISMSDVAASGGYLLSLGADKIVADSMTITGSIGVVSGKFNLGGLYNKLGITKDYVVKAKNALMFTSSKDFSEDEEAKLLEIMEFYYTKFVGRVSDSRKMGFEQAESFSKGRVWTGNQAKENGLVDELGTIQTAINIAKEKAEISETSMPVVKFYCEPRGVSIASLVKDSSVLGSLNNIFAALNSLTKEKVLTIMPYDIDIR